MEYKGYNVSEINSIILLDILQVQQEILAELKRANSVEPLPFEDDSPEVTEAIVQATEQIEALTQEVEKPVKKPIQKKPAKKKIIKKKTSKPKA